MTVPEPALREFAEETGFSGVVDLRASESPTRTIAYGLADRAHEIANTVDTRFGIASGAKTFTALTVVSMAADGILPLDTTARSILGNDLPLIGDDVTVRHLLTHTSGIGDYMDDDAPDTNAYVMTAPVHELATTEQYLAVLDGHAANFAPGERFEYSNAGYVVLALVAERAGGMPFHDLVQQRVLTPAKMTRTAYLRSDELPGDAAIGYLEQEGLRSNVFHLPVRGNGDGGIYTTVGDIAILWSAFFTGKIVGESWVIAMLRPSSERPAGKHRYGLGFWLDPTGEAVRMEGSDAGASFRSIHDPATATTTTVMSNVTNGAWGMFDRLGEQ